MEEQRKILVTGATGYVGGRLIPRLLAAGYSVRTLVRDRTRIEGRPWLDSVESVEGDALKPETLGPALEGVDAAYYLIHSMKGSSDFHQRDLKAAQNFGEACRDAGVKRILYLGGLGDPDEQLSEHLRSRHQTGDALRASGIPVTEFRAAIIVGAGSVSFEMIRYLTERIPVMVCPRWVFTRTEPIAVDDMLDYLVAALETPESAGKTIEIGGGEVLTYGEMMLGYAEVRGLKRILAPVPVLTPSLSSYWVHWMTPIPAAIARPLIMGLRNEVIVRDHTARELFPAIQPMAYRAAVHRALEDLEAEKVETTWSDALITSQGDLKPVVLKTQEGMIIERRQRIIRAPAGDIYRIFSGLGGQRGWLFADWAWRVRGVIDRLFGGVGLRRGRRTASALRVGDALDFWRVESIDPARSLRLRAEMKVPGRAWLEFDVRSRTAAESLLIQNAYFAPKGLLGLLYWYGLYPIHALIFSGLIREVAAESERLQRKASAAQPGSVG